VNRRSHRPRRRAARAASALARRVLYERAMPRLLPLLAPALALLAAACTNDDPLRELRVTNQSSAAVDVSFGSAEFGPIAAGAVTAFEPFEPGDLELRFDGRLITTERLASDNVGGRWDLIVLSAEPNNLGYGFTAVD